MKKQELVNRSENKRLYLDRLISKIIENDDVESLVSDKWRVKDVMAHIHWHEKEMEEMIRSKSLEGSPYWLLPNHERNEKIFQDYYNLTTEQIIHQFQESFHLMMNQVNHLSENAMTDASLFDKMPSDWEPWVVFAGNMYKHYEDHILQLERQFDYL